MSNGFKLHDVKELQTLTTGSIDTEETGWYGNLILLIRIINSPDFALSLDDRDNKNFITKVAELGIKRLERFNEKISRDIEEYTAIRNELRQPEYTAFVLNIIPRNAFIYFVWWEEMRRMKIGKTSDLKNRIKGIKAAVTHLGFPNDGIKLIYSYECHEAVVGTFEDKIHSLYSGKRTKGEWFLIAETDIPEPRLVDKIYHDLCRDNITKFYARKSEFLKMPGVYYVPESGLERLKYLMWETEVKGEALSDHVEAMCKEQEEFCDWEERRGK